MHKADAIRLRHMLDAAQETLSFVEGKTRKDLETDRVLALALVKSIEIIGEAANQVSPEGQAACHNVPWREIITMRNRLVHAYFDINLDIVWNTVVDELPPLTDVLSQMLSP